MRWAAGYDATFDSRWGSMEGRFARTMAPLKRWRWVLLMMELALFAIILIHPGVDLPEFTFHSGNAPAAVKYRFSVPAMIVWKLTVAPILVIPAISRKVSESSKTGASKTVDLRLSLLCTLIC
jgi:hypothetical protein